LVDILYYTYLKPTMILYYHRLYLVLVHKKTLENAAVEQLTSPLLSCMYKMDTDTAAKEVSKDADSESEKIEK
uniref:Reticulon-like protein n=1 Tax=Schistocephalus solidus TaxID=70667 RepID=A0A183T5D2_SCHSO